MSIKQIGYLSVRLLAIYIFSLGIIQLGNTINVWLQLRSLNNGPNADHSIFFVNTLGPFVLLTLISVIIWFSANKLTKYLVHMDEKAETKVTNLGLKEVQSLLFSTVGLVLLARSIPQLFQIIPEIKMINSNLLSDPAINKSYFFIVQRIFEFILGLSLFLGSKGLVTILNKLRGNH
ncbi:hypothetical protein [Paenibacillus aceti]|uniref:DUF2975 domain-containing protein n=1 Tax=Paenibacillus aceti TaxID=1820010 RepID=A0ABQ1W6G9_9BACL|nr:hypothetical protein [Paenibacillus aceti]GGG15830.1 hypothetical protein GCM10010913_42280 [Paenibacillus aceti]